MERVARLRIIITFVNWNVPKLHNPSSQSNFLVQYWKRPKRRLTTSERERRSNSHRWALSESARKITERERKLALIFALNMESFLPNFRKKSSSKSQESKLIFRYQVLSLRIQEILHIKDFLKVKMFCIKVNWNFSRTLKWTQNFAGELLFLVGDMRTEKLAQRAKITRAYLR